MPEDKHGIDQQALEGYDPRISNWFQENIGRPTRLQKEAWNAIERGENVLVASPTGTGKTLSAVLPGIDSMVSGRRKRENVVILYISPMKAMGADLVNSLTNLSMGIGEIPGKPDVRGRGRRATPEKNSSKLQIGLRTGDVPQSERRRMLKYPPDLLVTTPENLLLMLCSKARDILRNVRYVIIDEVHEMVGSKRGAMLSLNLEQLNDLIISGGDLPPLRVGLSATIKPLSRAARYVGGQDEKGKARPVTIVHRSGDKKIQVRIKTLMHSWEDDPEIHQHITEDIGRVLERKEGAIVVFHNTRARAEEMAYVLIQNEDRSVAPHHGSLSLDVRREAEEGLRRGDLDGVISSTSLELGIDIGRVKEVYQISSPKDPSRMLQRFGRSGHGMGETSIGVIYPTSGSDLIESIATVNAAKKGDLDPLVSPKGPVDVLGQFAIGLSISDEGIDQNELFRLSKRAFPYKDIRMKDLKAVLSLLSERLRMTYQPPPRLWRGPDGRYKPRRGTRQAFYLNCGTIPKENKYWVTDERSKKRIGDLSRNFGEALYEGDVILLGSRSYRVRSFTGSKILVREDPDAAPTVPSWTGEVRSRPLNVGRRIYDIYKNGKDSWTGDQEGGIELTIDDRGLNVLGGLLDHQRKGSLVPATNRIPVEQVKARRGRSIYIFHLPLGRKITEPLGRVLAYGIRRNIGARVDYVAGDDGFAVSSPTPLEEQEIIQAFGGDQFHDLALRLIFTSSMFRSRFTNCLMKSLLVLNRFRGKETSPTYRRKRVERLIDLLKNAWYAKERITDHDDPLTGLLLLGDEAVKEVLMEKVDLRSAEEIVKKLGRGIELAIRPMSETSNIIGSGIIRGWKGEIVEEQSLSPSDSSTGPEDIADQEPIVLERQDLKFNDTALALISGMIDHVIDPFAIAKENGISITEAEDELGAMAERGELIEVEAGGLKKYISIPDGGEGRIVPFRPEDLRRSRMISGMLEGRGLSSILRSVPFFTSPMELLLRSDSIRFSDLRSAVKGGSVVPYYAYGGRRAGHPKWARVFSLLSQRPPEIPDELLTALKSGRTISRSIISETIGLKGDGLSGFIRDLKRSNILGQFGPEAIELIGASEELRVNSLPPFDEEERTQEECVSICKFLGRFGPFSLRELSALFNWEGGFYPPGVISAVSDGQVVLFPGPRGPMEGREVHSGGKLSIWLMVRDQREIGNEHQDTDEFHALPETDPGLLLSGQTSSWSEKDRVRGARSTKLISLKDGSYTGFAQILETRDSIRVQDIEVEAFHELKRNTSAFIHSISRYRELGFDVIMVEKIMGIPAGEAARSAVALFLKEGFKDQETESGRMLLRGSEIVGEIADDLLLERMFINQGLSRTSRPKHPLEVIMNLGGISDRWELLSRLGTHRHPRPNPDRADEISSIMKENAQNHIRSVREISKDTSSDWSDLTLFWSEKLPELKDIAKKYTLYRAMIDQPTPVWSTEDMISTLSPRPRSLRTEMDTNLKKRLEEFTSEADETGQTLAPLEKKDATELIKMGLLMEDAWGKARVPFWDLGKRTENDRGVNQRAWILRAARNLGTFTYQDILNHSPCICDRAKFRMLLGELSKEHIQRRVSLRTPPEIVYSVEGAKVWGAGRVQGSNGSSIHDRRDEGDEPEEDLVILSPKDRMNRVSLRFIKDTIPKGKGFLVFKNATPIATLSLRRIHQKASPSDLSEGLVGTSNITNWTISNFSFDFRKKRKEVLRDVKNAFFSLGLKLLSEEEADSVDSLYKDIDHATEGHG
ncbi:MAG: DEAD/DEAH box helicase [Thermoplasmata archaeon]|nr:DEAD/DEAH box helicase [Thermoplasmata archaeon]